MMHKTFVILMLAGMFSNTALALDDAVGVKFEAQNNSGQNGTATLMPEGSKTKVVIRISNTPAGVSEPAHIHLGTCDNLDKAPKWSLQPVKDGQSVTVLDVPLDTILKAKTAINVHKSAAEAQVYVACGNIIPLM